MTNIDRSSRGVNPPPPVSGDELKTAYERAASVHEIPAKQTVRRYVPKPGKLYDCPQDRRPALLADLRALVLLANGYAPILAIGKRPVSSGWQTGDITPATLAEQRKGFPDAVNIGLRTGSLAGIDLDVRNPEHLRQFVELIQTQAGENKLHRRGAKGELLTYRSSEPIGKITISHEATVNGDLRRASLIEFLGEGQQFIAFGQHPEGMMYRWVDFDPDLELLSDHTPLTVPFRDIPEVTTDVLRALATKLATLAEQLGYKDVRASIRGERKEGAGEYVGAPITEKNLIAILSLHKDGKPVFDPNSDYTRWRDIVAPVGNVIVAGKLTGVEIACAWSRGDYHRDLYPNGVPLYGKPDTIGRVGDDAVQFVVNTMPPKQGGRNIGSIIKEAQDAGWGGNVYDSGQQASDVFADALPLESKDDTKSDKRKSRFAPIDLVEAERSPPPTYWDDGCLFIHAKEGAVTILSAKKGAHKTGVVMTSCVDFALHKNARIAYHLGEAPQDAARSRLPAICDHFGSTVAELQDTKRFRLVPAVPFLQAGNDLAEAIEQLADFKPEIVVIDTTARGLIDSTNKDDVMMNAFRAGAAFQQRYQCLVVLIAHFGKDEERGTKGSQSFNDAADLVIYLSRKSDTVFATMKHNRMGRDDYTVAFDVKRYSAAGRYLDVPVLVYRGQTDGATDLGKQKLIRQARLNRAALANKLDDLGLYDEEHSIPLRNMAEELMGPPPDKSNIAIYEKWTTQVGYWELILRKGTVGHDYSNRKKKTPATFAGLFFRVGRMHGEGTRDTRPVRFFKPPHYKLPDLSVDQENIDGEE